MTRLEAHIGLIPVVMRRSRSADWPEARIGLIPAVMRRSRSADWPEVHIGLIFCAGEHGL